MAKEREPHGGEHTRHYSLETTAERLGIPAELWEQPAVGQFIAGVNQIDNLQIDLAAASLTSSDQEAQGTPSLAARYQAAGELAGIISTILTDGLNNAPPIASTPERRNGIRELAGKALGRYGLTVTDKAQSSYNRTAYTSQQTGSPTRTPAPTTAQQETHVNEAARQDGIEAAVARMAEMDALYRERERLWPQWKAEGKNPWLEWERYKGTLDKLPPAVREVIENMKPGEY